MNSLIIAFSTSFIITLLIIRYKHLHQDFTNDYVLTGPQKVHSIPVPRIGGISIWLGICAATLVSTLVHEPKTNPLLIIFLCSIPSFGIGLCEDLTKKVSIKSRLIFTAIASILVSHYLNSYITKLDIPVIDSMLSIPLISILLTSFAITGLANSYNIIDGFNGLSSMVGLISLAAISYVGIKVGDPMLASLALVMIGAIAGFFIWNYPRGLIFLGDGGSYLIGFWVATLSIMLISRHSEISPWFALLVNGYPILETLFTIYRRKIHQNKNPGLPDSIHIHTLIFRRILHPAHQNRPDNLNYLANSRTSPYLWALSICAVMPAIFFWWSTFILVICTLVYILFYISIYKSIVRFKTPKWFHIF